jgi:hypothetical protein
MKSLLFSMLAATGALILFVSLLRMGSPPASTPRPNVQPIAAPFETKFVEPVQEIRDVPAIHTEFTAAVEPEAAPIASREAPKEIHESKSADLQLSPDELQTLKETRVSDTSLRNADFPHTYIRSVHVDLTSPNHWVRLTWTGPQAAAQKTGPFHSSPGAGLGYNNCDDVAESHRSNSNCTPKGTLQVEAFSETMTTAPQCRFVTWFQAERGVALHYYPFVPKYPASHGCVRIQDMRAAQLIHNNSKIGATEVIVAGKWTRGR